MLTFSSTLKNIAFVRILFSIIDFSMEWSWAWCRGFCTAGMLLASPGDVMFSLSSWGRSTGLLFLQRDVAVVSSWGQTSFWGISAKEIWSSWVMGAKIPTVPMDGECQKGRAALPLVKLSCQTGELTQFYWNGAATARSVPHSSLSGSEFPVSPRFLRELSHVKGLRRKRIQMWWNISWTFLVMEGFPKGRGQIGRVQIMQTWLNIFDSDLWHGSVSWLDRVTRVNLDFQSKIRKGRPKVLSGENRIH